jgi:hypothetical protein
LSEYVDKFERRCMPTPSPAALKSFAQDLRERATAQRGYAHSCETLLDGVSALDNEQTWQGSFPDSAHGQFQRWARDLTATAEQLRADAIAWDKLADQFDGQAGAAARVAPK